MTVSLPFQDSETTASTGIHIIKWSQNGPVAHLSVFAKQALDHYKQPNGKRSFLWDNGMEQ